MEMRDALGRRTAHVSLLSGSICITCALDRRAYTFALFYDFLYFVDCYTMTWRYHCTYYLIVVG